MNLADQFRALLLDTKEKARVAVIGDLMLDKHVKCEVIGVSPEDEGALKARVSRTTSKLGGAANVAANFKALGAEVFVAGVVGDDAEGKEVKELLYYVTPHCSVPVLRERKTTVKTRYLTSKGRHLIRIDKEDTDEIAEGVVDEFARDMYNFKPHIVAVSDYNKGVVTKELIEELSCSEPPFVVDPKKPFEFYGNASIITPNLHELQVASGMPGCHDLTKMLENVPQTGHDLLVTLSEKGAILYRSVFKWVDQAYFAARSRELGDPTGCGDSLLAGLVWARAIGADLPLACCIAVAAGSVTFDHTGVYSPSVGEILEELKRTDTRRES